jgi:hypothetical protein
MAIVAKVPFTLLKDKAVEDKKRYFRFDINALADFEQEVGMGFGQLMQMKAVFAATRALLWAGLKHEDRTLTVQKTGTLMQGFLTAGGGIDELLGAAMMAAQEQGALGKPPAAEDEGEDGEGNAPTTPTPPATGSSSSDV